MKSNSENEELLQRIARYLVINASFTSSLGLFYGKMGIVLFFCHYSRYIKNILYEEFANELLGEIYDEIHVDLPIGLENGLCGIAWGIEYLNQQKFVEGNIANVLVDIDYRIMERNPLKMVDLSLRHGLAGLAYYVACHVGEESNNLTVFDADYLKSLFLAMNKAEFKDEDQLPVSVRSFYENKLTVKSTNLKPVLPSFLFDTRLKITDKSDWMRLSMGIEGGLSGLGLKLMNL